ncbi:hypothetical protein M426DRAFT_321477 [Hypoxylon sp. CI-4A]|nr:hypothetical protein M426DRAFT_321477 [Hypoxylon sp. CI-4A]
MAFEANSYDTALCVVPPKHLWTAVDHLRSVYDQAYKKWPPHINLIYPFVPVHNLTEASESIVLQLQGSSDTVRPLVRLDSSGWFPNPKKGKVPLFLHDQDPSRASDLKQLRESLLGFFGGKETPGNYQMHMTIGQSDESTKNILLDKATLIPILEWEVDKLYILIRDKDKDHIDDPISSQMKIWGEIDLKSRTLSTMENPVGFYGNERPAHSMNDDMASTSRDQPLDRLPYTFSLADNKWISQQADFATQQTVPVPESLTVAKYNIHAELEYPPTRVRYPIIIQNLLERSALADVLVLEEVTDDFLSYICKDSTLREKYPYFSNGPPDQVDIAPLPYHLNILVLSKWPFSWDSLSHPGSQRGSIVVRFSSIGTQKEGVFLPAVLLATHLTPGLSDSVIESRRQELQSILNHLSETYPQNPWVLVGGFNIPTSVCTIESAVKRGKISSHGKTALGALEAMLAEARLVDTWSLSCIQYGDSPGWDEYHQPIVDEVLGGEQDATFDPAVNHLAAETTNDDSDKRHQRYNRILIKGDGTFTVTGFNMFGQGKGAPQDETGGASKYGSSHWGIRCSLNISPVTSIQPSAHHNTPLVKLSPPLGRLADNFELMTCLDLSRQSELPDATDIVSRKTALNLLKEVIIQNEDTQARGLPPLVMVPVGSYGLGVWTTSSDINCICIGPLSSTTFFTLAVQRLLKAASRGIKILRRVDAPSGTKLELEVANVKMDLQYCSATSIAETWPAVLGLPPTDFASRFSPKVVEQLKPMFDNLYIRRTIPDYGAFKMAHPFIKSWAKWRGIYGAKFGCLSGIQISILLSRVCKLLASTGQSTSAPAILTTFYSHYAEFDWKKDIVFDPFFHKDLRYRRTIHEPISILGFHKPRLNTAQDISAPAVHVISQEFKKTAAKMRVPDITWPRVLGEMPGATQFLHGYKSYVDITAQFWSISLSKGNVFVSWLESECATLFTDLGKQVPDLNPRIWPGRFVKKDASEDDSEYEGHYIIGLRTDNADITKEELRLGLERVQASLLRFEGRIQADSKHFDSKSCWMSATLTNQSEMGKLQLDTRDWDKYTVEAEEADIGDSAFWASMETEEPSGEPRAKKELPRRPAYEGKFRSAADVLNRLRWDQAMDSDNYIVGYEDRFLGAKERSVDSWKSETTDEEFIPTHRIVYFKRKSDGMVVWDREERRDEVFGSGVSSLDRLKGSVAPQ